MSKSKHLPEVAGADGVAVTGTLVVDTELRNLQTAMVNIMGTLTAGAGDANHVTWERVLPQAAGGTAKIKISAWDSTHAALATNAVNVSWMAIGN